MASDCSLFSLFLARKTFTLNRKIILTTSEYFSVNAERFDEKALRNYLQNKKNPLKVQRETSCFSSQRDTFNCGKLVNIYSCFTTWDGDEGCFVSVSVKTGGCNFYRMESGPFPIPDVAPWY